MQTYTSDNTLTRPHPRSGFTLVEVLVTTVLLVIVLGLLLYYPLTTSFGYFRSATARADAQSAARIALDAMARELTEAMYVQLDMSDDSMMAFVPPLRVDPDDPNSDIVMPPRADWNRAIRYWRALHDPRMNHDPGGHLGPGNTYYLARTVVKRMYDDPADDPSFLAPFATDDPWNRWDDDWAEDQVAAAVDGKDNWSPISRLVHTDVDWRASSGQVALRNATLQPGFPYLWVQYKLDRGEIGDWEATRLYRDNAVALTPNVLEYDISRLEFTPIAVSGESLRPTRVAGRQDASVYRAQYPLWRRGTKSTGWTALARGLGIHFPDWARDPFILISRYDPDTAAYKDAIGMFDPDSRTMKVFNLDDLRPGPQFDPNAVAWIYDTDWYYTGRGRGIVRDTQWTGFGVDWVKGALRFDFPTPPDGSYPEGLFQLRAEWVVPASSSDGDPKWDAPLPLWRLRPAPESVLTTFLIPDTVEVWTDTDTDPEAGVTMSGVPEILLRRVYCTPRENSYQFQLGMDPEEGPSDPPGPTPAPNYGWLRLPAALGDDAPMQSHTFWVNFRWHDNGVWYKPPGAALGEGRYYWDLVSAFYRTAAVIDIGLTVTRSDPGAAVTDRIAQSANMTRRVKLHNVLRRIRHAED